MRVPLEIRADRTKVTRRTYIPSGAEDLYDKLAPDYGRTYELAQFILIGRLDVEAANAHWVKEFMEKTGLTAADLDVGES